MLARQSRLTRLRPVTTGPSWKPATGGSISRPVILFVTGKQPDRLQLLGVTKGTLKSDVNRQNKLKPSLKRTYDLKQIAVIWPIPHNRPITPR